MRPLYLYLVALASACACACACTPAPPPPTWNDGAADVVARSCAGCHQPAGSAPFSLTDAQAAPLFAERIAAALEADRMPPWLPSSDPGCAPLAGDRSLSAADRALLLEWARAGAPVGEGAAASLTPPPPDTLDDPDLDLAGGAYETRATVGDDDYHCEILDPELAADTNVTAVEIRGGPLLHHALLFHAARDAARAADERDPGAGWTCVGGAGVPGAVLAGGWAPGAQVIRYPEGQGVPVDASRVFILQSHYHGRGTEHARVRLRMSTGALRPIEVPMLVDTSLRIPPQARGFSFTFERAAPGSATLFGIAPHMHTRGRAVRVTAVSPSGEERCLIDIPRWDFAHQEIYFFAGAGNEMSRPALAPGERVRVTCTYDNDGDRIVAFGEETEDEMCVAFLFITEQQP